MDSASATIVAAGIAAASSLITIILTRGNQRSLNRAESELATAKDLAETSARKAIAIEDSLREVNLAVNNRHPDEPKLYTKVNNAEHQIERLAEGMNSLVEKLKEDEQRRNEFISLILKDSEKKNDN